MRVHVTQRLCATGTTHSGAPGISVDAASAPTNAAIPGADHTADGHAGEREQRGDGTQRRQHAAEHVFELAALLKQKIDPKKALDSLTGAGGKAPAKPKELLKGLLGN